MCLREHPCGELLPHAMASSGCSISVEELALHGLSGCRASGGLYAAPARNDLVVDASVVRPALTFAKRVEPVGELPAGFALVSDRRKEAPGAGLTVLFQSTYEVVQGFPNWVARV